MLLRAIINSIESVAPRSAQEEWDNSGLQVGDPGWDISSVLLTTDVTPAVVNEAVVHGCELIISHHPLLFHGLKQVCGQTPQAQVLVTAIKHDIAIYSAHTSLDSVRGGINTRLADILGIRNCKPLSVSSAREENYLGVIGELAEPMPYASFLKHVRDTLHATYIRNTRAQSDRISTVALCGGSGAEFIGDAVAQGADAYVTADCKYHEFQDADGRIGLIDIDHWVSERHAGEIFADILRPLGLTIRFSTADRTPVQVLK